MLGGSWQMFVASRRAGTDEGVAAAERSDVAPPTQEVQRAVYEAALAALRKEAQPDYVAIAQVQNSTCRHPILKPPQADVHV